MNPSNDDNNKTLEQTFLEKPANDFKVDEEEDNEDEENPFFHSCGIGSWYPQWLQQFATPVAFLINMSLVGIIQGMLTPMFFGTMSTLERRFLFDSKVSAFILIADNLCEMFLSPTAAWLGATYNRSRLVAIGEMFIAISCFITALPYFIYGPAQHLLTDTKLLDLTSPNRSHNSHLDLCRSNDNQIVDNIFTDSNCETQSHGSTVWPAVAILLFGSFCRGIGFTAFFVIGFTYLDDNISKKSSPMFLSVLQAIRLVGPAFGYMLAAFCLQFYENPFVDPGIESKDPRFVGAWWLGFIIIGILMFIAALPMLLFPAEFKNASVKSSEIQKFKKSGGTLQSFKRIIRNPVIMLYMTGSALRFIGIGGYVMIKVKFIESHFRQSSSAASFITGTTSIAPMAVGILIGGAMLTIFKPSTRFIFIYVFIAEAVSIFTFGSGMFIGCDPIEMRGVSDLDTGKYSMNSWCNQNCHCTTRVYSPMCGPDGKSTFFSPCFAGCTSYDNVSMQYSDCSCIHANDHSIPTGYCSKDSENCHSLVPYLIGILAGSIISSTARTANSLISFRSVDPMDKAFTMAFFSVFLSVFAFTPYPFIFGWVTESTCLVWEEKCGKTGNCWLYDQEKFRLYFHGTVVFFISLGSLFDFILIFYSDQVNNFLDDDDVEQVDKQAKNLEMKTINGNDDIESPKYDPLLKKHNERNQNDQLEDNE